MESGSLVCPKCGGKGVMRYRVWESRWVICNIRKLKLGENFVHKGMWTLRITCPGCGGSGTIDWIQNVLKGDTLVRPFAALEGNMDIYLYRAMRRWRRNNVTYKLVRPKDYKFFNHIERLIGRTQERYTGIKLDPVVLTFNPDELGDLFDLVSDYETTMVYLPRREVTEDRIRDELKIRGLDGFMPDKFAYIGPDEFPH
jgi:rRNA maturation protein Nop10